MQGWRARLVGGGFAKRDLGVLNTAQYSGAAQRRGVANRCRIARKQRVNATTGGAKGSRPTRIRRAGLAAAAWQGSRPWHASRRPGAPTWGAHYYWRGQCRDHQQTMGHPCPLHRPHAWSPCSAQRPRWWGPRRHRPLWPLLSGSSRRDATRRQGLAVARAGAWRPWRPTTTRSRRPPMTRRTGASCREVARRPTTPSVSAVPSRVWPGSLRRPAWPGGRGTGRWPGRAPGR